MTKMRRLGKDLGAGDGRSSPGAPQEFFYLMSIGASGGGYAGLAVGAGWMKEEFELLGVSRRSPS